MQARFKELGIEAERFEAIRGGKVEIKLPITAARQPPLNGGELGCFLSHRAIYERIKAGGWRKTLILEDDAQFVPGFAKKFANVIPQLPVDWQMLYLGRWNYDAQAEKKSASNGEKVGLGPPVLEVEGHTLHEAKRNWLTHAYAVDLSCVDYLLEKTSEISSCIDHVLAQIQEPLTVYAFHPALVKQDGSRSSLR